MKKQDIEKVFKVIFEMYKEGVLKDYAIGGATATIYYTEPFATQDVDIFFCPQEKNGIVLLTPFCEFLLKKNTRYLKNTLL
ncbi:MAG: hypothetical protein RMJ67_05865 [Elusimicrobiota bacterium]|nr:hypothetical protein [Endomicrobiia bacterium]MDW8166018.1 hypothetical protein [Elusimicrobiota bacterium]